MTLNLAVGQNTNVVQLPQNLIAWHSRDSAGAITGVTTETGFVRIDGIPIRNGYHYEFVAPEVNVTTAGTNPTTNIGTVRFRFNLSGNATTASTVMPYGGFFRTSQPTSGANTNVYPLIGEYNASADGTMSVIMTVAQSTAGTGTNTVGLFASAGNPCPLFVYEIGLYPATSGVDI